MARKKREKVYLREGDGFGCSCGFITTDRDKYKLHMGENAKKEGHDWVGKVVIETKENANEFYYENGRGPVKLSVLSGTYGMVKPKKTKKTKKTIRKPASQTVSADTEQNTVDPVDTDLLQETDDDTGTDEDTDIQELDRPKDDKEEKKTKKDTSRAAAHIFEATQIKLVPKVYTITLTPTMMMTFHIVRNIIGCPNDWDESMILDDCLNKLWSSFGINLNTLDIAPETMEWLNNRNNGSQVEEVPV